MICWEGGGRRALRKSGHVMHARDADRGALSLRTRANTLWCARGAVVCDVAPRATGKGTKGGCGWAGRGSLPILRAAVNFGENAYMFVALEF